MQWSELTSQITGGTGRYAGARATVTATVGDGAINYSFDLICN